MKSSRRYTFGRAYLDESAGRYRVSVYRKDGDECCIVAAGYGDTPSAARVQAENARRTLIGADKIIESNRQAIAFAGAN
jgi:hypothetical protein